MKRYFALLLLLYILEVESCNDDQFQCADGNCFPLTVKCDDSFDCKDNSDEKIVSSGIRLKFPEHFAFKGWTQCRCKLIKKKLESGKTEQLRCTFTIPCPEGLFRCESRKCVHNKDECFTTKSEVQLSSSTTRHFPTLFSNAQGSGQTNILFKTLSMSRGNPIRSYATLKEKTLSSTLENVVFTFSTSIVKKIKVDITSTPLKQISNTLVNVTATVLSTNIVKPFNKETSSNIVFFNPTESKSNCPSSGYPLSTLYSKSSFELEKETIMSHNTWLQSSLQTTSRSYIMGLSYDYSQFASSIDDKTKTYRLSTTHLYLLYSSFNMKHSKHSVTKMISRETETFKTLFQNMSVPQTTAIKLTHISSSNSVLQLSNQTASSETLPETTSNSATIESNIKLTQLTSSILPLTSETSRMVTFSTQKPPVMDYFPNENCYKIHLKL
ncbi:unnamed protein product [Mytilus edulis]|uniref:Uncharacterized protein n=1 Tax=Mytilus edulis TaxID=6550 RepID=A0A8S3U2V3_MYTED|nr:unnamed protein product [Mytilus edulis]